MSDETLAGVTSKTVDHIAEGARAIASAVEKVAPHAWEVTVRQQRVDAWLDMAYGLVCLVALVALAWIVVRIVRVVSDGEHDADVSVGAAKIICSIIAVICMVPVIGVYGLDSGKKLANPEYYAAKELLRVVR